MDTKSRGYKILKNLKDQGMNASREKTSPDDAVKVWLHKRRRNWFCNRSLSPEKIEKSQDTTNTIDNILLGTSKETEHVEQQDQEKTNDNSIYGKDEKVTSRTTISLVSPNKDEDVTSLADNIDIQKYTEKNGNADSPPDSEAEPLSDSYEDPLSLYIPSAEDINIGSNRTERIVKTSDSLSTTFDSLEQQEDGNEPDVINFTETRDVNVSKRSKSVYKRKPDFCYFCETEVQNFVRHVTRNHSHECEVVKILAKPKFDKERRHLLDKLRRKGNYLKSADTADKCFKPVRRPLISQNLLPCDNCLGSFSSRLLYRHRKKCIKNSSNNKAQAAGQSQLVSHLRVDPHLKEQVFPHMRADKVSLTAKKDTLICAFGSRYLKSHREKHFVNVTSRKMRELAKILIEVQKMEPSVKNMFDVLQCKYFDMLVAATKIVAKYNLEEDRYESPTFALNIATSLKQCCDIAINFALKRQGQYANVASAEAEANLKTMIHLITSNWRFEISTQATDNLKLNKWNKTTIIPLASDLKLMRQHLEKKAEISIRRLKDNQHDTSAYNTLMEIIYCRVLLLNRRRPGELQRMLLHTYMYVEQNKQHYEEFDSAISSTEKILLQTMKRVVIRGKRGRGVPVLFSKDIQEHINLLLRVRNNFVSEDNIYLFAKSGLTTPIAGYKILTKYAKDCGAKNPIAITSTRLRKHLATLSQVFNLKENELEQLATFMGHTEGVHKNAYRLPDDIYQTAKISKVLLLMEKGNLNKYQGKTLDDIEVNLDEELIDGDEDRDDQHETEEFIEPTSSTQAQANIDGVSDENLIIKAGRKRELVPWTSQQKNHVRKYFKTHIINKQPPKKRECEDLRKKYPEIFCNKNWLKMKVFVQNEYVKYKD